MLSTPQGVYLVLYITIKLLDQVYDFSFLIPYPT